MSDHQPTRGNITGQSTQRPRRTVEQKALIRLLSSVKLDTFRDSAFTILHPMNYLLGVPAGFVVITDHANNRTEFLLTNTKKIYARQNISLSASLTNLSEKAYASNKAIYRNLLPESAYLTVSQLHPLKVKNILLLPIRISDDSSVLYGFINNPGKFTRQDISTLANAEKFIKSILLSKSIFQSLVNSGGKYPGLIARKPASGEAFRAGQRPGTNEMAERKREAEETEELQQRALTSSHLASIGELASGIAHEVNNPLASIVLYTQLLMEEDLPAKTKSDVMSIYESAVRAINIIRRLLTFARQQLQQKIATDINEMIAVTLELRKYALETSNIEVRTELAPDLPLTLADAGQIQQVFLNIVLNAEAEMKLSRGKGSLFIKTALADNTIKVSFTDDGPGITRENMSKIFDPFFTTREVGDGTGLGLSICHGIMADHDGKIYAESEPGKGATFYVEIPVIACRQAAKKVESVQHNASKVSSRRILIVDDEVSILDSLSRLLVKHGYGVDTVDNCLSALDMILSQRYDCILLDIKLPGMSGIELYKEVKKTDASLVRKIAFITGNIMERETRQFLQENSVSYFAKPFEMKQLIKDLDIILSREEN
jgi:signal transduction histidine kinase/CheY-like chemotaxis protein